MKLFFLLLLSLVATPSFGNEKGNGGDICELRIQTIRADIKEWIKKGGASFLKLPMTTPLPQYTSGMFTSIAKATVECVDETLIVDRVEKTCKNFPTIDGRQMIVCNTQRFMSQTAEPDQYVLVHHEFAGLAGIETNIGAESDYTISQQITGFLEDQIVKKLVVKEPPLDPSLDIFNSLACSGLEINISDIVAILPSGANSLTKPYQILSRHRNCNDFGSCTNWGLPSTAPYLSGEATIEAISFSDHMTRTGLSLHARVDENTYYESSHSIIEPLNRSGYYSHHYRTYGNNWAWDLGTLLTLKTGRLKTGSKCIYIYGSDTDRNGNVLTEYATMFTL